MNRGGSGGSDRPRPPVADEANVSQATGSRGTGDKRHAELLEHLQALADAGNNTRLAKRLGVDRKTITNALERKRLTPKLESALETERQAVKRAEADALEARLADLETALQDLGGALRGEWRGDLGVLREELASLRDELDSVKGEVLGPDPASVPSETLDEPAEGYVPRRLYPQLVAEEPAADDEQVYGPAWPLVHDWRTARAAFRAGWPHPTGREAEVGMLELELRLIEEHQLTLPPDRVPWDEFARRDELERRRRKLELARRNLGRARLRRRLLRIATLGRRGG